MASIYFSIGDIVRVNYPFEENPELKKLRYGIISEIFQETPLKYAVLYCTSKKPHNTNDYWLEFSDSFIIIPTYVNTCRAYKFEEAELLSRLSSLASHQLKIVVHHYNKCKASKS